MKTESLYRKILVPLEGTSHDAGILNHVRELARRHGSELILIHIAYYRDWETDRKSVV